MLRVAHVISSPEGLGGAEHVVGALVRDGHERGWPQRVLHPFALDPQRALLRGLVQEHAQYAGRPAAHVAGLPGLRRWTAAQLADFRPDVVHVHLFHAAVLVASLPRRGEVRVLTHHHGGLLVRGGRRRDAALDRWACRRADAVVAVSDAVKAFVTAELGVPDERVHVIPNGWSGAPAPLPEPDGPPVLVCVGRLRAEKGQEVLLDALPAVLEVHPGLRLLLAGDGPAEEALVQRAERLGVASAVQMLGPVDDVWPVLARADVFVAPSHYETLGMAALEAMAAGLPVVATAVGGLPELVQSGRTGLLVPPAQPHALARAILDVLALPDRGRALGRAGRAAADSLPIAETARRHAALYEGLMRDRRT